MIRRPPRSTRTDTRFPYTTLFRSYVVGTYADRLYDYANADLTIVRVQPVGSGYAVFSRVTQPGQSRPFEAIWSVMKIGDKFQITNLTVAGVNLALTQEADFRSVIQRNGFDALVRFMESRSEEHTSELQSLMRISYAVFCLKKKTKRSIRQTENQN